MKKMTKEVSITRVTSFQVISEGGEKSEPTFSHDIEKLLSMSILPKDLWFATEIKTKQVVGTSWTKETLVTDLEKKGYVMKSIINNLN